MYLLTELGRAGRENVWPQVMASGSRCAWSVRHDLRAFPFFFFFLGNKIRNVAHFDRKVGIYIATQLF